MGLTCLLTIHGVGYQQPPDEGVPGYADDLHERLRETLGDRLADDPNQTPGPVYVQSTWPPESHAEEPGLRRLGRLVSDGGRWRTEVTGESQRLAAGAAGVAHVAVIYSHLEEEGGDAAALVDVGALGLSSVVVNGHSSGSVVAFDVLAQLPPPLLDRVAALVTAGSPLRKYVDLLGWGNDGANLRGLRGPWLNFLDERDPVADPLAPPRDWRTGQPVPEDGPGLFFSYDPDTGERRSIPVHDVRVDNVAHVAGGGGLPAHDYWDNDEFCVPVARLLAGLASSSTGTMRRADEDGPSEEDPGGRS